MMILLIIIIIIIVVVVVVVVAIVISGIVGETPGAGERARDRFPARGGRKFAPRL